MDIVKTDSFGDSIRRLRKEKNLPLRKVAAFLDIDQAILSKLERGIRKPDRDLVYRISEFYQVDVNELLVVWLSDKILYAVEGEGIADEVLKVAEQKVAYRRTIRSKRSAVIKELRAMLSEYPAVRKAWLFGSYSRGDHTTASDIDIMIEVPSEVPFTLFDLAEIRERIAGLTGSRIDVVMERALTPAIRDRIKQDMELIYEA